MVADLPTGMSFSGPLHGLAELRTIEGIVATVNADHNSLQEALKIALCTAWHLLERLTSDGKPWKNKQGRVLLLSNPTCAIRKVGSPVASVVIHETLAFVIETRLRLEDAALQKDPVLPIRSTERN